jgi:hypothetical protein
MMKVQVLFDETGKIDAILHSPVETTSSKASKQPRPVATLRPKAKQRLATLDVPKELHPRTPLEIHESLRVELSEGSPRLVVKDE